MSCFGFLRKRKLQKQTTQDPPLRLEPYVYTRTVNGHEIAYTDYGHTHPGPAIVTFSGWNQDHRCWANVAPLLVPRYRVISICFRDHGPNRDPVPDYGFEDHADDVLALLDQLQVIQFVCMAASHGSWPAMIVAEKAGRDRVPAILILSLMMAEASPEFLGLCRALQGRETWQSAVQLFFKGALGGSQNREAREQVLGNMGGFGSDTWARSGRTIEQAYKQWGSPLKRMEQLDDPPLIHHLYSQPDAAQYHALHREFRQKHPKWFSYTHLAGETHCPHMENPAAVQQVMTDLIQRGMAKS